MSGNIESNNYYLEPGGILVSDMHYQIHTVLGSCVSVCIWDEKSRAGGMNHFVLPEDINMERRSWYGDVSILYMLKLLRDYGINTCNMKAHLVGGGFNPELGSFVGDKNIAVAESLLKQNNIFIATKDVGGSYGRKIIFNNITGEILVYKGVSIRRNDWYYE